MSKTRRKPSRRASRGSSPWLWVGGIALVTVLVAAALYLSQGGNNGLPLEVDLNGAKAMRDAGAFVLDVRREDERGTGYVPDSTWIPLDQLQGRLGEVPRDRDILVVCQSGNRSGTAREILLNSGYARVTSLRGGVQVWQAAGYPFVTGP
jgi:rhodanese-related sulfurtransferase